MSSSFVKKAGLTQKGGRKPFFSLKTGAALWNNPPGKQPEFQRMTPQRRKLVLTLFTTACVFGLMVAIFLGYQLFQNRMKIFWLFSAYISALTGVVIFFGFRLIKGSAPEGE